MYDTIFVLNFLLGQHDIDLDSVLPQWLRSCTKFAFVTIACLFIYLLLYLAWAYNTKAQLTHIVVLNTRWE